MPPGDALAGNPSPLIERCASSFCKETPQYTLMLQATSAPDIPLAYACTLPHFADVMHATRHLSGRRTIVEGRVTLQVFGRELTGK